MDAERPSFGGGQVLGYYVHGDKGGRICQTFENCLVTTQAEAHANTRLIAAAPELLRAAHIAHGMMRRQFVKGEAPDDWGDDEHEAFCELEKAIKKATVLR